MLLLATTAFAVAADVIVDDIVRATGPRDLIGQFLRLAPATNDGVAFGLLQGTGPLPLLLGIAALIGIGLVAVRMRAPLLQAAFGLLLGGALANLLERIRYGAVLDYVDMGIGSLRWPTYNVGDVAISAAVVLLVVGSLARPDLLGTRRADAD